MGSEMCIRDRHTPWSRNRESIEVHAHDMAVRDMLRTGDPMHMFSVFLVGIDPIALSMTRRILLRCSVLSDLKDGCQLEVWSSQLRDSRPPRVGLLSDADMSNAIVVLSSPRTPDGAESVAAVTSLPLHSAQSCFSVRETDCGEQGAAIGFSMGASVFSHRAMRHRTHTPSRSRSLIFEPQLRKPFYTIRSIPLSLIHI